MRSQSRFCYEADNTAAGDMWTACWTQNKEVDVDLLFVGDVQLVKTLQPLVEASETTSQVDES